MKAALLYEKLDGEKVRCNLCSHYCDIEEGKYGTCLLRKNVGGELYTYSWGAAEGFAIDPIEKKPFFHFKPGAQALSFGTPGCNFRCKNCQNWNLSQANKEYLHSLSAKAPPESIAEIAVKRRVDGIAYTYSEPTIFFEYARDVVRETRKLKNGENLFHVFISNGFMTKETVELIDKENIIDAINIDLKFMNDDRYKKICYGKVQPVLDNIKRFNDLREKIHLELINLVIPGENDTVEDISKLCRYVKSVSPDIPIHFNRFYPTNKMIDKPPTDLNKLLQAREIALDEGLEYVFIGNTALKDVENTYCPNCNELLIQRSGYGIQKNLIKESGKAKCPKCDYKINIRL